MSRAFAPESMAHCAAKGHRWRQVRAWNAVGWHECYCCGETRGGLDGPAPVESSPLPTTADASASCEVMKQESVAAPSPQSSTAEPARYGDATPTSGLHTPFHTPGSGVKNCFASGPISAGELVAAVNGMVESIAPKKSRPPRAPVGTRPHGGHNRKADRDREVLAMLAANKPGKEIAAHFGLTESRISQIKKSAVVTAAGES